MKAILHIWISIALLMGAVSGCKTTEPPTREAIVYYSFADTWHAAHIAYQSWCEQVVLGKVNKSDEAEIDKAWNQFRADFQSAFRLASGSWSAAVPKDLEQIKDTLLVYIRASIK